MREFGVMGFGDCFIEIDLMHAYNGVVFGVFCDYVKLGCWGITSCPIMFICLSELC